MARPRPSPASFAPRRPSPRRREWGATVDRDRSVQPGIRKKTGKRLFGIGQPIGVDSSDSFYSTFMDAYNVKLVDAEGKLLVDDPKVKEGLIGALGDYVMPMRRATRRPPARAGRTPTTTSPSTTRRQS
jgi:multiple sugar transport system substrate-binding protein